jgi:hypothetical protein
METKFKLSKLAKNKWIRALKSDKYKQGKGYLYNKYTDAYCCLGVAKEEGLCSKRKGNAELVSTRFLPNEIQSFLASHNDGFDELECKKVSKWSFKRIANWIEKNL